MVQAASVGKPGVMPSGYPCAMATLTRSSLFLFATKTHTITKMLLLRELTQYPPCELIYQQSYLAGPSIQLITRPGKEKFDPDHTLTIFSRGSKAAHERFSRWKTRKIIAVFACGCPTLCRTGAMGSEIVGYHQKFDRFGLKIHRYILLWLKYNVMAITIGVAPKRVAAGSGQ